MRELLDDAHANREAGLGRAQAPKRADLPKRFYRDVGVAETNAGYAVSLDRRSPRTPGQKPVVVAHRALAEAMAQEWAGQGDFIDPETMPVVRLINSAIEAGPERLVALREEVVKYAGTDLMLYRADAPAELVAEQERLWDEALVRLARHFSVAFQPTIGILHQAQPEATLRTLAQSLETATLIEAAALVSLTGLTGSGLLVLGLREHLMTPEEVWEAAHVDEDHNIRLWGAVAEATERRQKRRREFDAALLVLTIERG